MVGLPILVTSIVAAPGPEGHDGSAFAFVNLLISRDWSSIT